MSLNHELYPIIKDFLKYKHKKLLTKKCNTCVVKFFVKNKKKNKKMNGMLVVPITVFNNSSSTIPDQGLNSAVRTLVQSSTVD